MDRMVVERESFEISVERKIQPKRNTIIQPKRVNLLLKADCEEDIIKIWVLSKR